MSIRYSFVQITKIRFPPGLLEHLPAAGSRGILIDHRFRWSSQLDEDGVTQQYYIATKSSPADDRARVLKYGRLFSVFDHLGDIQTSGLGEQGLFFQGTRHLSELLLRYGMLPHCLLVPPSRQTTFSSPPTSPTSTSPTSTELPYLEARSTCSAPNSCGTMSAMRSSRSSITAFHPCCCHSA
jgi:hypothetical protein